MPVIWGRWEPLRVMHVAAVWLQNRHAAWCAFTPTSLPASSVLAVATGALLVVVAAVLVRWAALPESLEAFGVFADRVAAVGRHELDHLQGHDAD